MLVGNDISALEAPQKRGSKLVQRLSPLIVFAASLIVSGLAYENSIRAEKSLINEFLAREEQRILNYFERESAEKVNALKRLARVWELVKDEPEVRWKELSSQLLRHFPQTFQAIEYVGTDFKIRRVEPVEGNEAVIGLDIRGRPFTETELLEIGRSGAPRYTKPFSLKQGPRGMILYVPVYDNGKFDGLLISVFHIEKYISDILQSLEHDFAFKLYHRGKLEYQSNSVAHEDIGPYSFGLMFTAFGDSWKLMTYPRPELIRSLRSEVVSAIPWIGLFLSILISTLLWLFIREERARRALEVERRRANEASNAKGRFLATMSHEIRTPLNGILVAANLLSKKNPNAEEQELVDVIRGSGESLMALVNDTLDFAKIEAKKMELEEVAFDLPKLVASTVRAHALKHKERPLKFEWSLDEEIPSWIIADPYRLTQVINNLIGNAAKFTEKGKITLRVSRESSPAKEFLLHFKVEDTGIGIEPEKLSSIFEDFSQADSSMSRRFGGTGLGLTICKHLVELMGGSISVSSSAGAGSCFEFTIRAQAAHDIQTQKKDAEEKMVSSARSMQILVAEDNLVNQKLIRMILEKHGHECIIAQNGLEAVQEFQKQRVDLILMDMQMPELDGLDATKRIRALESAANDRIPIIALSANTQPEDRERCFDAGMDAFLAKPIAIRDLVRTIAEFQKNSTAGLSS